MMTKLSDRKSSSWMTLPVCGRLSKATSLDSARCMIAMPHGSICVSSGDAAIRTSLTQRRRTPSLLSGGMPAAIEERAR